MASRDEGYKFWLNINVYRSMFNLIETAILTASDAQVLGSEFDHKIFITTRLHISYIQAILTQSLQQSI